MFALGEKSNYQEFMYQYITASAHNQPQIWMQSW